MFLLFLFKTALYIGYKLFSLESTCTGILVLGERQGDISFLVLGQALSETVFQDWTDSVNGSENGLIK